jgi:hypothetical protein
VIIWPHQIAVIGALLILVAACAGDGDETGTLPDVTPVSEVAPATTTPTPTPTVEPPVEPSNAHEYTAEGVEAFTRYAIDVINYAYQTNDVSYLEQIMTPDCQTCANTVARLTAISAAGGRVEGGQVTPSAISIVGPAEGVQTSAGVDLTVTASRTIDGEGQVRNSEDDRDRYYIFNLGREGEAWKLEEILRTDEPLS